MKYSHFPKPRLRGSFHFPDQSHVSERRGFCHRRSYRCMGQVMSKESLIALRDNMVQRKNEIDAHITQHLKDYKHSTDPSYSASDNKVWAVKDARLSAQFVELSHFILALNREIMN